MPNPFDQFDAPARANPFDQFDEGTATAVAVASAPGEFLTRGQTPQGFLSAEHVRQLSEPREAPAFDLLANQRAELADMEARRNSPEERAKDEMVARWSTIANPVSPLDVARARSVVGTAFEFLTRDPNAEPTGQTFTEALGERDVSPTGFDKAAAGVQQVGARLTSPETMAFVAATAGLGALPVAAQRATSLGFAGWMAANAGTQAAELEQAVKDDDVEAAARATAGLGLDSLFAGLSAKHGLQGIAARNPRLAGWLSKRFVQEVPPEQVRGVLDRAAAGTATAGELDVAGLLRSAGLADAAGAGGVALRGQVPRVGPAFQDWLGVPNGRGSVEVRVGRPVNPVDRLLLEDAAQSPRPRTSDPIIPPSPPETVPSASQASTPRLPTSPALRGEAAMETRPTAEMGLDRTRPSTLNPELSTDLAETIAALRAGYRPEEEKAVESPKAQSASAPGLPDNSIPKQSSFQDWRIQGNTIRHSVPGSVLTEAQGQAIVDMMPGYGVRGRWDAAKKAVVVNSGLMSDVERMWSESGSIAKKNQAQRAQAAAVEERRAQAKAARAEELKSSLSAAWIDEVFGSEAMNSFNKAELSKFLEGKSAKFGGQSNPKWQPGLARLGATSIEDVRKAYESQSKPPTPPSQLSTPPLSTSEVSEFNALEQQRRAGTLEAPAAARYRELEVRAGQGDFLAPPPKPAEVAPPKELAQVSDDVTWKTGAGDIARSTVQRISKLPNDAEPMADVDWFGVKRVPVSQLQVVKKSSRRVAEELRLTKAFPQVPEPSQFNSVAELLSFRKQRLAEEVAIYQQEIGLTLAEAERLQELMALQDSTKKFEAKIGPAKAAKLEQFFEYSHFNQKAHPLAFKFWERDTRLDPEQVALETDKPDLVSVLISAVDRGVEANISNDRFLSAAIAAMRLNELGGTLTDVAKQLDRHTTKNSSSQGDKAEYFKSLGEKVNAFLASQGIEFPQGEFAKPAPNLPAKPKRTSLVPKPKPAEVARPAEVRPAEAGEQPKPPAQAAPAMQEGMDNLRFTSDPVKTAKAGGADAKDAKTKLIAELEKAVEVAESITPEQKIAMGTGPYVPSSTDAMYSGERGRKTHADDVEQNRMAWEGDVEKSGLRKVTVEIPGDGTFTVWNTKENLSQLLSKAKRLETSAKPPKGFSESGVSKEDREWTTQMQAAQGKPMREWEVRYRDWNNNDLPTTVQARTAFEAEDTVGSTVKGAKKILPGTKAVQSGGKTELRAAQETAASLAGAHGNALVEHAKHVEDVVRPLEANIRKLQADTARLAGEAARTKKTYVGKKLTQKQFLSENGFATMEEANARYQELNAKWAKAEQELVEAKAKEKDLLDARERLAQDWSRATTRLKDVEAKPGNPDINTGALGGSGHASVGDFRAPVPAQAASKPQAAADAGFAESGLFVDGVEVRLGGSEAVNPVLLPEMFRLFHELTGGEVPFLRRYRKANGMFYPERAGRIGLHPDLFKFPHQVAYTFAHELGHLVDYLPDRAMDRGNVLGRIGALRNWLTTTFPLHPKTSLDEVLKPNDRAKLRREAEKAIGPKPSDKTDAAAWQEQVSERYGEMVEQEIEARGLISLKQVRDELLAVSQWWRPYDPATATESYRAYRESGVELYADALSVLFNSPGHLEQKAPTFYKAFWNWLDAKPEFKAALARVQELLGKGDAEVLRARVADDRADFAKGRETFEAAHAEQERLWSDPKEVLRRLERQLLDKGAELERLAKAERGGGVLPVGPDLREKWEQMNMADNLIYQFSARLVRDVVKPLQDAGLDANTDLGIYLKHARIQGNKSAREELDVLKARLGRPVYLLAEKFADLMEELERKGLAETMMIDKVILPAESAGIEFEDITELARLRIEQGTRADLANPRMVQAKESERTLNQYLSDLGPAKAAVLKQAVQAFHDEVFKLVEHGHRAGIFSDRQLALAAVNKDTYAAFRPLEYVDTYVQPTMRKAKGSAKPIENPFVTTMLKMQSLADLIMRQESLNTTRDTMQRLDPEAFKLAETFWTPNGKQARSAPRDRVRLVVREQGKPVAYDVDPAIAEAYQKLSPYEQNVAARWVNWLFHQSLYKAYVSWSLPFNLWNNPWRDVSRTQLNMAAVFGKRAPSVPELARAYKDAWDSAKKYTQGELTPLSQEALDFYAIYAPTDAFYAQFPEDNASHAIMVKLGLAPEPPNRLRTLAGKIPVVKQAVAFGDFIMHEGQKREAVGKLGPWLALQRAGVNPEQAAAFVRNYVGTPNIKSAGSQSYIPNAIFPFYRIYSQAARTWVRLARNPQTRGGYFYQWAITRGTLRALLGLAGLGAFGTAAKQWIDGVPEYERTRGIPLPLPPGSQPGGDYGSKSVFLRIPDDEFSALLGYSLDNAIRAAAGQKEPGKAASDAAKQWLTSAPGLNTYADLASQWMAYAGGGEPRDNFRGRPVLSEAERKAGGTAALGKMAQFTADKSGIPFMRQNPTEPTSTPEAVLRFVPLLKDIVKVTDAGFREKDQAQRDAVEKVKYAIRMDYGDNTKFLLHRHAQLDRAGTTRTLPQEADYRYLQAWHSTYNRFDAAVVDAQQRGEKGAAKERIAALERLSASTKTALDTGHAARDAAATGGRNLPWSPRLTNAVPVRR